MSEFIRKPRHVLDVLEPGMQILEIECQNIGTPITLHENRGAFGITLDHDFSLEYDIPPLIPDLRACINAYKAGNFDLSLGIGNGMFFWLSLHKVHVEDQRIERLVQSFGGRNDVSKSYYSGLLGGVIKEFPLTEGLSLRCFTITNWEDDIRDQYAALGFRL